MEGKENLQHWERWAIEYGSQLRATTKCVSIKRLEIEALLRRIPEHASDGEPLVLEVGCGNGTNGFALVSRHPRLRYLGLDFSPAMIANALGAAGERQARSPDQTGRLAFGVADARRLRPPVTLDATQPHFVGHQVAPKLPAGAFDIVFTDRMLINLSSAEEQLVVMERIASMVRPGGLYLMLENSVQTAAVLNQVRRALGLPARPPAEYNVFIDEPKVIGAFEQRMTLVATEDFGAIHDLMLYAVEPSLSGGEIQYDTPRMTRVTDAILALAGLGVSAGGFGQNRLWVWRK